MRRLIFAALLVLLAFTGRPVTGAQLQERLEPGAPVPVDREPRHRPVFANDALRVIRLEMPLNDTSLFHTHTHDNLTVRIAGESRAQTLGGEWGDAATRPPGSVGVAEYIGRTAPAHRVQNVGSVPFLQVVVENLRVGAWSAQPAIASPELSVLQENRAFRAYKLSLASHGSSTHRHAVPTVVVLVSGKSDAGSTQNASLTEPGAWALIPANVQHTVRDTGPAAAELVEVEVR
jgi:quercetin dioxygenase-like cupin family protein